MNSYGVVVGRFQTDALTVGHLDLLKAVQERHGNKMIILVGIRPIRGTDRDPLGFVLRSEMLRSAFPAATVLPLKDASSNETWSNNLDTTLAMVTDFSRVIIYHGRDGFGDNYVGRHKVIHLELPHEYITATEIRTALRTSPRHTPDFRAGVIHAHMGSKPTWMCVDTAIVRPNGDVLMGHKTEDGPGVLRFPGGGVDPEDDSLEAAASREGYEETGIMVERSTWEYVASFKVGDWRLRGTSQTIHTTLFTANLPWTEVARAGDDLDEIRWVSPNMNLHEGTKLVPEHKILWRELQHKLRSI